jgi:23S rRNA pseudouridine1911/1915/1917 synthase
MTDMKGREWTIQPHAGEVRLDKFLASPDRLGSRGRAAEAIARGKVFVNDREVGPSEGALRLSTGDRVRLWVDRPGSARARPRAAQAGEVQILFEDSVLLVVNKPAGLLAVPLARRQDAESVYDRLQDHLRSRGRIRPLVVHRIDRDTSGLVVFAKNPTAQQQLKTQFRRREPERVYLAVVYGHPMPAAGVWRDRLVWDDDDLIQKATHPADPKGKEAISEYRIVERFAATSLIQVRLVTGKRNQIRLQARLRGHTLVGEKRYVYGPDALRTVEFARQALHAWKLGFVHPADGRPLAFEAPLPSDMAALLRQLREESRSSREPDSAE